ncbi:MAG: hypothetical protein H6744_05085 [Deltaproteobacteria bacterium]|nr:hypothetical protein [Deltaproteobacteria bacterium]MCB9786051.1 hypothetical protein [Deltaproteobacteria bacterium]
MSRGARWVACLALLAASPAVRGAEPAPTRPVPPPPELLFGCPIAGDGATFEAPETWALRELPELGISLRLPASWIEERSPELVTFRSANGDDRFTLRRGRLVGSEHLATVRKSFELRELGPSHAGPRCEEALRAGLAQAGFQTLEVGVYARPFGRRQRSYAVFGGLGEGSLTAVLTVRWSRPTGPDLLFVRRMLGGLRALSDGPPEG